MALRRTNPIAAVPTNRIIAMIASQSRPSKANPITAVISQITSKTMMRTATLSSVHSKLAYCLQLNVLVPRSGATSKQAWRIAPAATQPRHHASARSSRGRREGPAPAKICPYLRVPRRELPIARPSRHIFVIEPPLTNPPSGSPSQYARQTAEQLLPLRLPAGAGPDTDSRPRPGTAPARARGRRRAGGGGAALLGWAGEPGEPFDGVGAGVSGAEQRTVGVSGDAGRGGGHQLVAVFPALAQPALGVSDSP